MLRTFASICLRIAALIAAAGTCASSAHAASLNADAAAQLQARYVALSPALDVSPIQQGLLVESVESSRAPRGDAYAILNFPFPTVSAAFTESSSWCEALILHLNVQYCRASVNGATLSAAVGKKVNQPLDDTHRIQFSYKVAASDENFMRVELAAKEGPLGTGNYLIAMELIAIDPHRTFMHLRYSYTQGFLARCATSVYFATSGRNKVGFTMIDDPDDDVPHLVGGIRGALERNTIRYYLALDAYLHALATPPPLRFDESLQLWFADTERFARQLHEVDRDAYVTMKRGQYLRQQISQ